MKGKGELRFSHMLGSAHVRVKNKSLLQMGKTTFVIKPPLRLVGGRKNAILFSLREMTFALQRPSTA